MSRTSSGSCPKADCGCAVIKLEVLLPQGGESVRLLDLLSNSLKHAGDCARPRVL